jgi:hypothetical protein
MFAIPSEETHVPMKLRDNKKKKEVVGKICMVPLDSPTMGTRSKKNNPTSSSKRRLNF